MKILFKNSGAIACALLILAIWAGTFTAEAINVKVRDDTKSDFNQNPMKKVQVQNLVQVSQPSKLMKEHDMFLA